MSPFASISKPRRIRASRLAAGLCALFWLAGAAPLSANDASEAKLMTAIIYKLPKFVSWPPIDSQQGGNTFGLCHLGGDTLGNALSELGKYTLKGRAIEVRHIPWQDANPADCQMVFIGRPEQSRLKPLLESMRAWPSLLVSDIPGFARAGGGIELQRKRGRFAFSIHRASIEQRGLKLAAPLLDMATIVDP